MEATATELNKTYVDPNDRVLDPSLIEKSLIERMPKPTGWRLLILPYRGKGKRKGLGNVCRYAGSRFKIDGGEVRILNDDEILAKIMDPEDVLHY